MKKLVFFALGIAALLMSSCGMQNKAAEEEGSDTTGFEQTDIDEQAKMELDSLAKIISNLKPIDQFLDSGMTHLSADERKVKPDYLFNPEDADEIITTTQAYRAIGMMYVDMKVAGLYSMKLDAYKAAMAKLSAEINDPDIDFTKPKTLEDLTTFYKDENENGRIDLFWELTAAANIETLYVITKNIDKFMSAFDDESVSNLTYHLSLLKKAISELAEYDDEVETLDEALSPLAVLDATTVEQFKKQIVNLKSEIKFARIQLLQ